MTISDYIIHDVEIRPITEKISSLKKVFNELTYSHVPVEKNGVYIGCVSETDLRCFDSSKTLADYQYTFGTFFVKPNYPLLDILKVFAQNDTNLLPVLDEKDNRYLGYLELNDVLAILEDTPFLIEEGNIIVVEKGENDFSFSEISQIVESNNGKIFGMYISKFSEGLIQITIKVNNIALNEILQTFRRYDYTVVSEHEEDSFLKSLKERSDYLKKYLNI